MKPRRKTPGPKNTSKDSKATRREEEKEEAVAELSCGECQFGMAGDSCDLAIRIGGKCYFVDGAAIDDFGDAHAEDGFCNSVRKARVVGRVVSGRYHVTRAEVVREKKKKKRNQK
jgi:hypothetical protein